MLDLIFAVLAGILTIAAPCTLPILLGASPRHHERQGRFQHAGEGSYDEIDRTVARLLNANS